jgi:hypothetical protein
MLELAIITPSYIASRTRADLAARSLASLRAELGDRYPHIVVDDLPRLRGRLGRVLPDPRTWGCAPAIYRGAGIRLLRQWGRSSSAATLRALREARRSGCELVFLHLDDNVYQAPFAALLGHAIDACRRDAALLAVRLTGHPILSGACTPELGNRTLLRVERDAVSFDGICLRPERRPDYTLWWSSYHAGMMDGAYWAIPLWFTVYRCDALEKLLTLNERVARLRTLAQVELYYKDAENWRLSARELPGKLAYVNMQFGGLEMEHNRNWRELLALPNEAVR